MRYLVPDMSCGHCKSAIENALSALGGQAGVQVDLESKTVEVSGQVDPDLVIKSLAEIGFEARPA